MSDKTYVGRKTRSFESAPQLAGYSRVVVQVSDELEHTAGDDSGRTLTHFNPLATQKNADDILARVSGYAYKSYSASGAILDPAAELGDGVTVCGSYVGIYTMTRNFGRRMSADISAPCDEEIDHEYPYKSKQNRLIQRQTRELRATLRVQAGLIAAEVEERKTENNILRATLNLHAEEIEARVSKEGGDPSSFSWKLLDYMFSVSGNSEEKFRVDSDGAFVNGIIRATGGKIGLFDIMADYLSYNGQTWGGTNSIGIYQGPEGIQCGSASDGAIITSSGDFYANNGYFRGSVNAGNIQYGGSAGYMSGGGISSGSIYGNRLAANTVSTAYTSSGINKSLGYADFSNGVFNGWNTASNIYANSIVAKSSLYIPYGSGTRKVSVNTVTIDGYVYNILTI